MNGLTNKLNEIKKAIPINPLDLQLYSEWRRVIKELDNPEKELEEYRTAVEKNLNSPDGYYDFGNLLYDLNKYEDAIFQYKKAIEKDPDYKYAYHGWGLALDNLDRHEEAIEQYMKALDKDPDYLEAFNSCGWALAKLNRYEEAIVQYKKAIEKDPGFIEAYASWGRALLNLQNPEKELYEYRTAIEKNLDTPDGYNDLGNLLQELKKYEDAIVQYKKAIVKDPNYKYAYYNWGLALQDIGQYQEAIEMHEIAVKIDPKYPYPVHNIAFILEKQGNYYLARSKWTQACAVYELNKEKARREQNADYFLNYASIYHFSLIKDIDKAEGIYKEGLKINPKHSTILFNLGRLCLERKGASARQKKDRDDSNAKTQAHCQAWEYLRSTKRILEDQLKKKPDSNTLSELGKLYLAMEDYPKAKDYLLKAIEKDPHHQNALSLLGTVYLRLENFKDSISYYRSALNLDPDDLDLRSNLAEAYLKAQMNEKAEIEFRKILDITSNHHMDSLIGIGETYTAMGEDAQKRNESGEGEEMFARAFKYFSDTLRLVDFPDHASKLPKKRELSALFYSRGYSRVMLYETQKRKDSHLLEGAMQDFKKVEEDTANFYKAQRAIEKIQERLNPPQNMEEKWGPRIIQIFSIVVFLLAQCLFFIGKPILGRSQYSITKERLDHILAANEFDAHVQDWLNSIAKENRKFFSLDQFSIEMKKEFGEKIAAELSKNNFLAGSGDIVLERLEPLEPGYYVLITFGSLIFMVAGLYLRQISKLKVGAIELEKSTVDQITVASTLGISKMQDSF